MHRARLIGLAFAATLTGLGVPASAAPPQITLYLGGQAVQVAGGAQAVPQGYIGSSSSAAPASSAGSATTNAGSFALGAQVGWAQAAAYARYVQYVQYLNYQQSRGIAPSASDAAQYFTNGAAATTVPSSGQPGSAYFTNGSEVGAPPGAAPVAAPPPVSAPPVAPPPVAPPPAPPPGQSAHGSSSSPWWWGDAPATAQPQPPPPSAPATPPTAPAAAPASQQATAVAAMSFDEWLVSMGAAPVEAPAETEEPPVAASDLEGADDDTAAPLSEPFAAALEVRTRLSFAPPEKRERRAVLAAGSGVTNGAIAGAFAAGLLLGALAMLWPRRRASGGTQPL